MNHLTQSHIETPLGTMKAIADEKALYLLEFLDNKKLEQKMQRLENNTKRTITTGTSTITQKIEEELEAYFAGKLSTFKTPLAMTGTAFQNKVWRALCTIPCGETWSYADLAKEIGQPTAFRAVAGANGANWMPLIIPCHRVINKSGALGGYSSGLHRKEWLLKHEVKAFNE